MDYWDHQFWKWLDQHVASGFYTLRYGKWLSSGFTDFSTPPPPPVQIYPWIEERQHPFAITRPAYGQSAVSFVPGDFNGDGIEDTANFGGGSLKVTLRDSSGNATAAHSYNISHQNGAILAADFNGDGILDLAMVSQTYPGSYAGNVAVVLGHGDGTFGSPLYFQAGASPISIAVADLNGDGNPDLIVGNISGASTPGTISIFLGKGDGTFTAGATYSAGLTPLAMLSTDFNNDGRADLAVIDTSRVGAGDTLYIFLGNGDGTLRSPGSSNPGTSIGALAFADLNHDGNQDLVISDTDGGGIVELLGNGDGSFQPPKEYVAVAIPQNVSLLPQADGSTEVSLGDDATGFPWAFYIGGDGTVFAPLTQTVGTNLVAIGSADPVLVLLSNGNGQFSNPVSVPVSSVPDVLALADVNNDGNPDVVMEGGNGFGVLLGKADGTFGAEMTTPAEISTTGLAIADFNSDGKLDIAFFDLNGDVSILYGNGNGTFSSGPTASLAGGPIPASIFAGDFNSDGKQDLAVAYNSEAPALAGSVNVLLGDGHGGFHSAAVIPMPGAVSGVSAADLNHDGKLDLIARNTTSTSQVMAIALGKGDGTFGPLSTTTTAAGGSSAIVIDLDGDGNPDLVLTDGLEPSYLLGNGDGTFQAEIQFPTGQAGNLIAPANLNGNGNPAIVAAGNVRGHGTLVALINTTPSQPVMPVTAVPASGSSTNSTLTFTFTDSSGYQNLSVVDVLINNALDGRHACYIAFVPSSANGGSLYLVDDAGDAGGPYQGLVLPGGGSISNSQCTINGTGSLANGSGANLNLTLNISFSASFTGNKIFYLSAQDKSSYSSGWQALGTWGVPGAQAAGPSVGGVTPPQSSSLGPTTYTFTFNDTNGWQDIAVANILINNAIDGRNACYIAYVPSSKSLFLVDDAGDAAGPYLGMTLPGTGSVFNNQCYIAGAGASVNGSGNTLTLALPMSFSLDFGGNQLIFLAARSNTASSNWQAVGSVSVP